MKRAAYIIGVGILGTIASSWFTACIDFTYDDIQPRIDSIKIEANTTISELKSAYTGKLTKLTDSTFYQRDSILIEGIVTSDDRAGNFYKSIIIQDTLGYAIEVKINKTGLYNDYKIGQRVVIYCNDLYLGDYGGLIQLGSIYTENGVTEISYIEGDVLIKKHIFKKGGTLSPIDPVELTSANLVSASHSKLIKLSGIQFKTITSPIDGSHFTYADAKNKITINHLLDKGAVSNILLRTSGYAKFAGDTIPGLNGTIVGILGYYNGDWQLMIRDTYDVNFTNPRE